MRHGGGEQPFRGQAVGLALPELDNFLRLTRKDILTGAGKVQAKTALAKAEAAYAEYQARVRNLHSPVEKDFEAAIAQPVKQLERGRKVQPRQKKGDDA